MELYILLRCVFVNNWILGFFIFAGRSRIFIFSVRFSDFLFIFHWERD